MKLSDMTGSAMNNDVEVTGLALDSRAVQPGFLFAAFKGSKSDGTSFIPSALEKGASVILTAKGEVVPSGVRHIVHPNPRQFFAEMAAKFYAPLPQALLAVTGTNGKTSVAHFTRQLWTLMGKKAASIGTLGVDYDSTIKPTGLTTPDTVTFFNALHDMKVAGVDYAVYEASSHGLSQYRTDGAPLKAAAITNITRDHLDYHADFGEYKTAKARVIDLLADDGALVLNIDMPEAEFFKARATRQGKKLFIVGSGKEADLHVCQVVPSPEGLSVCYVLKGCEYRIHLPLMGAFQAENVATAIGLLLACGENEKDIFDYLPQLQGVPGRMEYVGQTAKGGMVYIDYAHTPDGLKTVLVSARAHTPGKLAVVFGCGGDRDRGKRPEMGVLARQLADKAYVTDDNPRSENPAAIRKEILTACPDASEWDDRAAAIHAAVADLHEGDVLLVTGKGHEEGQVLADRVIPFSDFDVARKAISASGEGK